MHIRGVIRVTEMLLSLPSTPPLLPLAGIQSTDNCAQTIAVNRYSTSPPNSLSLSLPA